MSEQIILGIPGVWKDTSEVAHAIAHQGNDLLFAGFTLMDSTTQEVTFVEWHEYDPRLVDVFETLGQPWIKDCDLARIANHHGTLWVFSSDVSINHARQMMKVGRRLLQAGGLGVKVETSGVAHSAERWQNFEAASAETSPLYCAYVNLLEGDDYVYSCGMHNFGLPDVSAPRHHDAAMTTSLLHHFNQYHLDALPHFNEGDLFSQIENAPCYQLNYEACESYEPEHPFYNPFGRWHLTPQ
jgi:hypothetical protein